MPPSRKVPSYRLHKASGQAVVTLSGRDCYLGCYNSDESRRRYHEVIGEWLRAGRVVPPKGREEKRTTQDGTTVSMLICGYWEHAQSYYRKPDGTETRSVGLVKLAMRRLRRFAGDCAAAEFGPIRYKALRQSMIGDGLKRKTIERYMGIVKDCYRWGVEEQLIDASVLHALRAVRGLAPGRTEAVESEPVKAVPWTTVAATLPYLPRPVAALVRLQWLTGARGGELFEMRAVDLDTGGTVWLYQPQHHKTEHHNRSRVINLGPRAQNVIKPFLAGRPVDAPLFDPADSERGQRCAVQAIYNRDSYARCITRACEAAFSPPTHLARGRAPGRGRKKKSTRWETEKEWRKRLGKARWDELVRWRKDHHWHPHQLRHAAATEVRRQYGLEAARAWLGHAEIQATQLYAEQDSALCVNIAKEIG